MQLHEDHQPLVPATLSRPPFGQQPRMGHVTPHLDVGDPDVDCSRVVGHGTPQNELDKIDHGTHPYACRTHCSTGHPYDEANTRHYRGRRYCRACQARWNAARNRRTVGADA